VIGGSQIYFLYKLTVTGKDTFKIEKLATGVG
jgi:hypothetical protein